MDKELLVKLLEALTENDGEEAQRAKLKTEEDAIKHAEWAAKLKPGDKVNLMGYGVSVVSPEGVEGNRVYLFRPKKQDDGTYTVGGMLVPITAITPVN